MRVHGRNLKTVRNNHLKKSHDLPADRFSDLDRAESMCRLERLADVRSAVVLRGKALIANPNYPDRKTIRQISRLLANHIRL
jgi:hypothetical protein